MATAEGEGPDQATIERPMMAPPSDRGSAAARWWAWAGLAVVLVVGLALRLWGVRQGLPYVYNSDEADHFVTRAVAMFAHGTLNPKYFANPPAFTYMLHGLFDVRYGGASAVVQALVRDPTSVYTLARVASGLLGTAALWLLYLTGARLFNRAVGLLAAAIQAVAFLPVFYAHLALGDAPTLAPVTLSLLGSAGVLRKGRARDYLLAGVGLGLASATKYTGGIVIVPLLVAIALRGRDSAPNPDSAARGTAARGVTGPARQALRGLALAGVSALAAFLIANPYALLDFSAFHRELVHQSTLAGETQGKLGAPREGGLVYYLWSFTWGLGWLPSLAALGGALTLWRGERRLWWLLVPAALVFLAFMGLQGRYFGRWLLPIFPIVCLLAAHFALRTVDGAARLLSGGWVRPALGALVVVALLAQGFVYSVHAGLTLSRADTRTRTRDWMLMHIPAHTRVVVEPVSPKEWGERWHKYFSLISRISATGALVPGREQRVGIEDYERTLSPALIGYYEHNDYCWVATASTESGRALADPRAVPHAVAYYRALARQGEVVFSSSPYARGERAVAFNFDWSFDYYPLAYARPGPQMTVYRLHGGRCA